MGFTYPDRAHFGRVLKEAVTGSLDLIVVATAALDPISPDSVKPSLSECARALRDGGLLFVQGRPDYLPELGVFLDRCLSFKYWIALKSIERPREKGLPSVHAGLLLFTKHNGRFNIKPPRLPHRYCSFCQKPLKDWGGKTHLMNPDGYVVSDVWLDLPPSDNYTQISKPVLDLIWKMAEAEIDGQNGRGTFLGEGGSCQARNDNLRGVIGPEEGLDRHHTLAEIPVQYRLPGFADPRRVYGEEVSEVGKRKFDVVHLGEALRVLKRYPDNSVDLAFADPPYNLDKPYGVYEDEREDYIAWCNAWLAEYVRVLKPTGSLYVLNLPRWAMHHAAFLNQHLYFQNWIVWDALSEPRGKLMPAHYGLLFYTKHPTDFTFNYSEVGRLEARYYCLRSSCIRQRKAVGVDDKEPLADIWWNIHRISARRILWNGHDRRCRRQVRAALCGN